MTTVPSESEAALIHILDNVFVLAKDSSLRQALQQGGYKRIQGVVGISNTTLASLTYKGKDASNKAVELPILLREQGLINALKGYAVYTEARMGRPLKPKDWLMITEEAFDEYQGTSHMIFFDPSRPPARLPPAVTATVQSTIGQVAPEVLDIKRVTKRATTVAAFRARMTGAQRHKSDSEPQHSIQHPLSNAAKEVIPTSNSPGSHPGCCQVDVHMYNSYPDFNMGSDDDGVGVEYPDTSSPPEPEPEPEP